MPLDRLATEAQVIKRTIYPYVGDKAEVFAAVVARLNTKDLTWAELDITSRSRSGW